MEHETVREMVLRAVRRLGQLGVRATPTTVMVLLRLESGRLWPSYEGVQGALAEARNAGELEQSRRGRPYSLPTRRPS